MAAIDTMPTRSKRLSNTHIAIVLKMTFCTLVAVVCLLNSATLKAGQPERDALFSQQVRMAVDGYVMPRLKHLEASAEELSNAVRSACATGTAEAWQEANSNFKATVLAWAAVSHLRFGPFELEARARRLSFHPDPRAIVWRQVRRALAKKDPALLQPGSLANQSIALQGLTALENLLANPIAVGETATPDDEYKCALATAVAANVFATSQDILAEWSKKDGWRERLFNPASSNTVYKTHVDTITELAKSALLGFQIIRDQQIGIIRKTMLGLTRLSRLPYYRSRLSGPYIRASTDGMCAFFEKLDLISLLPKENQSVRDDAAKYCNHLTQTSKVLLIPYADEDFPGKLTDDIVLKLYRASNKMRLVIGRDIAPIAGLTMGFNSLDGD